MHKKIIKNIIRGHPLNPDPSLLIITPSANLFINSSIEYLRYLPRIDHRKQNIILLTSINQPWSYCNLHSNIANLYSKKFYNIKIYGPNGIIQLYQNIFQNTYMRLAYKVPSIYDGKFKLVGLPLQIINQMRKQDQQKFNSQWIEAQKQIDFLQDNQRQFSFSLGENLKLNIIKETQLNNSYSIIDQQKKLIWISQTLNQQKFQQLNKDYEQIYTYKTEVINKKITIIKQQSKKEIPSIHTLDFLSKWELIILGTASAQPTLHKNTSAYLFRCEPEKFILLQCGPNTHIQLYKAYGKQYWDVINKIQCIFITHFHSDHHFGLIKILEDMINSFKRNNLKKKVVLLLPKSILNYVNLILKVMNGGDYFSVINSLDYRYQKNANNGPIIINLDFLSCKIRLFGTQHCFGSSGIVLQKYKTNKMKQFKVVYTGDTKQCQNARYQSKDSDLFMHESTFLEIEKRDTFSNHSDLGYVLQIARMSNCTNLAITHYDYLFLTKLKQLIDNKQFNFKSLKFNQQLVKIFNKKVIICHDFLKITDKNQKELPKITREYCAKNNQQ